MSIKLNKKAQIFVAEYLIDQNATRAYIASGYSKNGASQGAERLLRKVEIRSAIEQKQSKRLEKLEITADRVLQELALIGFANMSDYVQVSPDGKAFDVDFTKMTREQAAAIQEVSVDATGGNGDGERRLVLRSRFKLASKKDALELLGKHLKLFTDKVEQSGPNGSGIPIDQALQITFVRPK